MKPWVGMLGVSLGVMLGVASVAGAVELTQATNDQILGELSRRLQSGPGPGPGPGGASAAYLCDASGYLYIHLTGPDGKTVNKYYGQPTVQQCMGQANVLNQRKTRVNRVTIAAICDSSGYLYRLTLLPDGKFGDAPYTSNSTYQVCVQQATSLNGG